MEQDENSSDSSFDLEKVIDLLLGKSPDNEGDVNELWNLQRFSKEDIDELPLELFIEKHKEDFIDEEDLPLPQLTHEERAWINSILEGLDITPQENGAIPERIIKIIERRMKRTKVPEICSEEAGKLGLRGRIFEFCAWYQSPYFHSTRWGIYIRNSCVLSIANFLYKHDPFVYLRCSLVHNLKPAIITSLCYLFIHELYHYKTDLTTSHLAIVASSPRLYPNYWLNEYKPTFLTSACIEEALANRNVSGRYRYLMMTESILRAMLLAQPDGYRHFYLWDGRKFHLGEKKLIN